MVRRKMPAPPKKYAQAAATRSTAVRRRRSDSARPSSRGTPGGGDERGTVTNSSARASGPSAGLRGQQYKRGSGNGPDIGQFARDVNQNFGRGVAEVGRQVGSVMPKGGRQDPLAGNSLGRAVNQNKGKSWINR